jgi:hypothetical protein
MRKWDHVECLRSGEEYAWYNVLWTDWYYGIAKRKTVGRMHKDMWESKSLEIIDLALG